MYKASKHTEAYNKPTRGREKKHFKPIQSKAIKASEKSHHRQTLEASRQSEEEKEIKEVFSSSSSSNLKTKYEIPGVPS